MKKFSLFLVLYTFAATAFAQLGIQAGANIANLTYKLTTAKKPKPVIAFQVGVVYDMAFSENLYLNTGLLYSGRGSNYKNSYDSLGTTIDFEHKTSLNYLNVPINILYKTKSGLYLKAGPYLAYAISGRIKLSSTVNGKTSKDTYDFKFGKEETNPLDYGLGIGLGMDFNNIRVGLGYDLGFSNLFNDDVNITTNRAIVVTAAYYFGEK